MKSPRIKALFFCCAIFAPLTLALKTRAQVLQIQRDGPIPVQAEECSKLQAEFEQIKQSASSPIQAQTQKELYQLGLYMEACDELDNALTLYQWAKARDTSIEAEQISSHPWDQQIGPILVKQQKFNQALLFYRQVLTKSAGTSGLRQPQIEAFSHERIGAVLLVEKQLNLAIRYFQTAIKLDPENPLFYRALANALVGQEQFDDAAQNFERADEYSGFNLSSQRQRARALHNVARYLEHQGQHSVAREWYDKAISADPSYDISYLSLAGNYAYLEQFEEAIATLKRSLEIDPSQSVIHHTIARYYTDLDDQENALVHFKKAVSSPQIKYPEAHAWARLGHILKLNNRHRAAANSYEHASRIDPSNRDYLRFWGEALYDIGQWEQAVNVFMKAEQTIATSSQTDNQTFRLGIPLALKKARSLAQLNRVDEAIAALKPFIDRTTRPDPWLDYHYGRLLMQAGRQAEADTVLRMSGIRTFAWSQLVSIDAMVLGLQGDILNELGQVQEARSFFEKAIATDQNFAFAYGGLGDVLRQQGQYEDSVQAYQKALQFEAREWRMTNHFWTGLGQTHLDSENFPQAIEAFQSALQYQKENLTAQHGLGVAYLKTGNVKKAIAAFKQVLKLEPEHLPAQNNLRLAEQQS